MNIKIDEQFKTIIPPLTDDEFARLKESILQEGIRDKLVVWDGTLIDGHNRYRIATENNLPFETVSKEFETREHALNWIIENQLGRRNLNPNQIAYLRGKRYECEKKIVTNKEGANQYRKEVESHNGTQPDNNTSRMLGAEYGIGKNTVLRNARFSRVVDILPEEVKSSVLSGNEKITHPETETILKMPKPIQKQFIKEVEKGTPIKEAVKKVDPEAKQKENDERIRKSIERDRQFKERSKFLPNYRKFNDATSATKQQFMDNINNIPDDVVIWVFYKGEKADEARITINKHTNLKID